MTEKTLSKFDLKQFTGTETWFRHALVRDILYTEGAQYVAEYGGAYWLLDEIVFSQAEPAVKAEPFQVWCLRVADNKSATLTCDDGNGRVVFAKQIEFTDFPMPEFRFYFTDNTILLPSEY